MANAPGEKMSKNEDGLDTMRVVSFVMWVVLSVCAIAATGGCVGCGCNEIYRVEAIK